MGALDYLLSVLSAVAAEEGGGSEGGETDGDQLTESKMATGLPSTEGTAQMPTGAAGRLY